MQAVLINNTIKTIACLHNIVEDEFAGVFENVAHLVAATFIKGGRVYIIGNGGSASDAQHLAAEFIGRFDHERRPLPAEALTTDTSTLTAIGNDYGYDQVFSRQIEAKMTRKDILIAISTSGNSQNVLKALELTKTLGYDSVLLSGRDGGKAKDLATLSLIVPSDNTAVIQQVHLVLYHSLIKSVEVLLNV